MLRLDGTNMNSKDCWLTFRHAAKASRNGLVRSMFLAGSLLASFSLASCGKERLPDQTIVAGDSFEITLPELEQVLLGAPRVRREEVAPARRALLDALIGQKLLAEAADKDGLDKKPDVVRQLAASRRVILANAYISKIGNDEDKPSDREIARYYNDHPGLFKDRLEFAIDEFVLPLSDTQLPAYAKLLDDRGFEALRAVLARRMPDAKVSSRTLTSSDVPAAMSNAATRLKPGSDISYRTANALHLGRVTAVQPRPVSLENVRGEIAALIAGERRNALISAAVNDLKRDRHVRVVNADLSKLVEQ